MPLVPELDRQRQVDLCKFEAYLVYRVSSRTVRAVTQRNPVLKQNKQQQQKQKVFLTHTFKKNIQSFKTLATVREMAQSSRVSTALSGDLSSVPSNKVRWLTITLTLTLGEIWCLWSPWAITFM